MENLKYSVGDEIELRVRVEHFLSAEKPSPYYVTIGEPGGDGFWATEAALSSGRLISRPLKVGDRVRFKLDPVQSRIIAIDGNVAWVKYDTGGHSTAILSDLERVP